MRDLTRTPGDETVSTGHGPPRLARGGPTRQWLVACTAAEAIGMTAAAAAAAASRALAAGPVLGLGLIIAGGLVEGLALGCAQSAVLARTSSLRRLRYVLATVLVAGLGWAAGSAPSALADDSAGGPSPPLIMVLLGAAGIGLAMGPLLGAAQASALHGAVRHPWRWIAANSAAWPVVMVIIFVGASRPGDDWPLWSRIAIGLPTGMVAGAALGLITGWFLPSLDGETLRNRVVLRLLTLPHPTGLDRRLIGLSLCGRRSGRRLRLPVQYARDHEGLVVVPGHADRKNWWRNLDTAETPVEVLHAGRWTPATARLLHPGDPGYLPARQTYSTRWPALRWPESQPVVRVRWS